MNIIPITPNLTIPFKWRDRHGNFHHPSSMPTRHLFYTLRMIWNHSVPPQFTIDHHRRYTFSSHYTPQYMCDAFHHLARELSNRTLTPYMRSVLSRMHSHIRPTIEDSSPVEDEKKR